MKRAILLLPGVAQKPNGVLAQFPSVASNSHDSLGTMTPHEYSETATGLQLALASTAGQGQHPAIQVHLYEHRLRGDGTMPYS